MLDFMLTLARFFVFLALTLRLTRPLIQIWQKASHQPRHIRTFYKTLGRYFSRVPETLFLLALYSYYVNRLFVVGIASPVTLEDAVVLDVILGGYWLLEALPFRQRRRSDRDVTKTRYE
jgi:hypothetical protein